VDLFPMTSHLSYGDPFPWFRSDNNYDRLYTTMLAQPSISHAFPLLRHPFDNWPTLQKGLPRFALTRSMSAFRTTNMLLSLKIIAISDYKYHQYHEIASKSKISAASSFFRALLILNSYWYRAFCVIIMG